MKPTIGRIVHYHLAPEVVRPAIVVNLGTATKRLPDPTAAIDETEPTVTLHVFLDPFVDQADRNSSNGITHRFGVFQGTAVGEWSWPPRE